MSGDVTSIPSFTRSGRPSRSFSASPPSGRRCTAFRASRSRTSALTGSRSYRLRLGLGRAASPAGEDRRARRHPRAPRGRRRAKGSVAHRGRRRGGRRPRARRARRRCARRSTPRTPVRGARVRPRVDQRARRDVLHAVAQPADGVHREHEPEHEPERREELPEPLDDDAASAALASPARETRRATRFDPTSIPTRPGAEDDADPDVLHAQDVLDVDEVGGDRGRHEQERDEDDDHHQPDEPVARRGTRCRPAPGAVLRATLARVTADGERQAGGPTTTNDTASTDIAAAVPPTATRMLPQTGPKANPSARAVSTMPFAACSSAARRRAGRARTRRPGRSRFPSPRSDRQHEQRHREPRRRARRDACLRRGHRDEEPSRLDAIDEQADVPREHDHGRPEADEDRRRSQARLPFPTAESFACRPSATARPVTERREADRARRPADRGHVRALRRSSCGEYAVSPGRVHGRGPGSEGIRRQAPRRRGVPEAEREARQRERRERPSRPQTRPAVARHHRAEPGRDDRHRDGGEQREHEERDERQFRDGIAARSRTPTPALPPIPCTRPMPKAPAGVRTAWR